MTTRIISRAQWGARHGRGGRGQQRRNEMVIHTEAGGVVPAGWTLEAAMARVRQIEAFHTRPLAADGRGWTAIGYSFLVDPLTGWAFEGRGWGQDGAHTQQGRNESAHAICFLGHGDLQAVSPAGWAGAAFVIEEGLRLGHITPVYVVTGHRNYAAKSCPGGLIYPHIGRLRGLTPTPKDWFTMATADQLRTIVREELTAHRDAGIFVAAHANRQLLVYANEGLAIWIRDPAKLAAIAARHGVRSTPLTDAEAAALEVVA